MFTAEVFILSISLFHDLNFPTILSVSIIN